MQLSTQQSMANDFYKESNGPKVSIVSRSKAPNGVELVTYQLSYWRAIHSELMTHRMLSRSASSSRAEPTGSASDKLVANPTIPLYWGLAQKGMQADDRLKNGSEIRAARGLWLDTMNRCVKNAKELVSLLGIHKQNSNRLLEPFSAIDVIVSATDWDNFFALRCHPAAEPHLRIMAWRMADLMYCGQPANEVPMGGWHLPYVTDGEKASLTLDQQRACSVARCARVSYRNHDGSAPDVGKDLDLFDRLRNESGSDLEPGHWSPFEHQATPLESAQDRSGNYRGWRQYRSLFARQTMGFNYQKAVDAGWRESAYECLSDQF